MKALYNSALLSILILLSAETPVHLFGGNTYGFKISISSYAYGKTSQSLKLRPVLSPEEIRQRVLKHISPPNGNSYARTESDSQIAKLISTSIHKPMVLSAFQGALGCILAQAGTSNETRETFLALLNHYTVSELSCPGKDIAGTLINKRPIIIDHLLRLFEKGIIPSDYLDTLVTPEQRARGLFADLSEPSRSDAIRRATKSIKEARTHSANSKGQNSSGINAIAENRNPANSSIPTEKNSQHNN